MPKVRLEYLHDYLQIKLDELITHLKLEDDPTASQLTRSEAFPTFPSEGYDLARSYIPAAASRERPLAWGNFNPDSHLRRDCAQADVDVSAFTWIPLAVDGCFSRLLAWKYGERVRSLLRQAIEHIETYVDAGSRSWYGLQLDGLSIGPGRAGTFSRDERTLDITDDFGFVGNLEGYGAGLILRRFLRNDSEEAAERVLSDLLNLLRIYTKSAVATPIWWMYYEHWETLEETMSENDSGLRNGTWLPEASIDDADIGKIAGLWETWASRARVLDAAIERFEDAVFSMNPADTAAHAIICLESVVASRTSSETDKRTLLTRRAPRLLAATERNLERSRGLLGRLYGTVRTGKAHTDSLGERDSALRRIGDSLGDSPEELALEVLGWASAAILELHGRLAKGATLEGIWSDLDKPIA